MKRRGPQPKAQNAMRGDLPAIMLAVAGGSTVTAELRERGYALRTFMRLCESDPKLRQRWEIAERCQVESWADEIIQISDDGSNDTYVDGEGRTRTDHDVIARSKLRIETRLKLMGKKHPSRYGEKVDLTTKGEAIVTPAVALPPLREQP